jgi:hypothetical protein
MAMSIRPFSTLILAVLALVVCQSEAFSALATGRMEEPMMRRSSARTVAFLKIGRMEEASVHRSPSRRQFNQTASAEALHQEDAESEPNDNGAEENNKPMRKGYQRVEDWDAEEKAGGFAWEQKVQFDGLRHGNGFRQNQILQKHLSSF